MKYITDNQIDKLSGEVLKKLAKEPKQKIVIAKKNELPGGVDAWEGGLNGYFFRIKRGVEVELPRSIVELIRENERVVAVSMEKTEPYRRGRGKKLG